MSTAKPEPPNDPLVTRSSSSGTKISGTGFLKVSFAVVAWGLAIWVWLDIIADLI